MSDDARASFPQPPLPPRSAGELAPLKERRSWAFDALDALSEARGKRARDRGDSRLGTYYTVVMGLAVAVAMGGSLASRVFSGVCTGPSCAAGLDEHALSWLGVSIVVAVVGCIAVLARALGPAGLSPARRSWLGSSPSDRSLVLRDPLATVILSGAVVGMVGGLGAALALASGRPDAAMAFGGATFGVATGAVVVLLAALVQGTPAARLWVVGAWASLVVGIVGAAVSVGPWPLPGLPAIPGVGVAGAGLLVLLVASVVGWGSIRGRLRSLPHDEIRRGGDAADAASACILMLETGALEELRGARARAARGRFPSRSLRGRADLVIVSAEARRLRRARTPLYVAALLLAVPLVLGPLTGPGATVIVTGLLGIIIGNGAASGLRLWTRSTSVRRLYPLPVQRVRLAYLAVPGVLSAAWFAGATALTGLGPMTWAVLTTSALAAVLRSAPQSSTGLAAGQMSMTPMGAVPVGLMAVLMRGPDVAALPVALLLLGFPDAGLMLALAILISFCAKSDQPTGVEV